VISILGRLCRSTRPVIFVAGLLVVSCSDTTPPTNQAGEASSGELNDVDEAAVFLRDLVGAISPGDVYNVTAIRVAATEPAIQSCVQSRGFAYQQLTVEFYAPAAIDVDLPAAEYVSKHGFGISTLGPPLLPEDPNLTYSQSLSKAERESFALAVSECSSEVDVKLSELLIVSDALEIKLEELKSRVATDPRILDVGQVYRQCMDGFGYGTGTPLESRQLVVDRLNAVPEGGSTQPVVDFELAIAAADFECGASYQEMYQVVRQEAESEFLEVNRTLLPSDLTVQ
jgi:hypothetical protein